LGFFAELTETQRELQQLARKFTKEEIIPTAAEYDKTGAYPWDVLKKAWSVGLMNSFVPEKYGKLTPMFGFASFLHLEPCLLFYKSSTFYRWTRIELL